MLQWSINLLILIRGSSTTAMNDILIVYLPTAVYLAVFVYAVAATIPRSKKPNESIPVTIAVWALCFLVHPALIFAIVKQSFQILLLVTVSGHLDFAQYLLLGQINRNRINPSHPVHCSSIMFYLLWFIKLCLSVGFFSYLLGRSFTQFLFCILYFIISYVSFPMVYLVILASWKEKEKERIMRRMKEIVDNEEKMVAEKEEEKKNNENASSITKMDKVDQQSIQIV
uniref:Uncharacterized protein n=1 Tax=Caenorhabditis japonica TaxID=281687 RepID=A0A8R1DXT9_CAEJA